MTKNFEEKVIRERIVDTAKYRYVFNDLSITRIELCKLDTTAAYEPWEIVKKYN